MVDVNVSSSEAHSQNLTVGTSWLVAGKTIAFAFTIAIPMLLVRRMPQHEFGLYKQIFLVINSAVTLLPLGFGMTAFYFLPRDEAHRSHVVFNIVAITTLVSALFGAIVTMFPTALVLLFKEPAAAGFAPWMAAVIVLWVIGSFLEIVIVANQEIRLASGAILAVQITRAALFVLAAVVAGTIRAVLLAALAQGVVQVAALALYLRSRFPGFWRAIDWSFLRSQLAYALPFGAAGLLYSLQLDLHNYFVSQRFGPAAYAVYAIGCFQLPLFGILAESVGSVMIPRVSFLEREGQTREIIELTARAMRKLALIYFPAYAFLMIVRREFIVGLFTTRYLESVPLFAVNLTLIPLGIFVLDPIIRAYAEHRHFPMKLHALLLFALVVALPLAIQRFGLMGAISVVVAIAALSRAAGAVKVASMLGVTIRDIGLLTDVAKTAVAAGIAGAATAVVRSLLTAPPLVVVCICAAWFGVVYLAAILALGIVTADERALMLGAVRRGSAALRRPALQGLQGVHD